MRRAKENMRTSRRNSGQVLLIAAFIMASLLLSAQLYVIEVGKISTETETASVNDFILVVDMGSRHVVIGSVANISNGGPTSVLASNLEKWSWIIGRQYKFGKNVLNYTLRGSSPYSSGIWTYWGTNGFGTSSGYVNFTYTLKDREVDLVHPYFINVTTSLLIESSYRTISGDTKQVNVTITVLNEGQPAPAKQIAVQYKFSDNWLTPNDYTIMDYGNGTYTASFTADIPSATVEVSARVVDQRGIFVQANATGSPI